MVTRSVELRTVRRSDPRQLVVAGPPVATEAPSRLRTVLAFAIDTVVHAGLGFAMAYAIVQTQTTTDPYDYTGFTAIGFVGFSIVDRVFVQWACRATVGKLLTDLRVVRADTGGRGNLWHFARDWMLGVIGIFAVLAS